MEGNSVSSWDLLEATFKELQCRGLHTAQLFGQSASLTEIRTLYTRTCAEGLHKLKEEESPHVLAGLVVWHLHRLPQPLVPFRLYSSVVEAGTSAAAAAAAAAASSADDDTKALELSGKKNRFKPRRRPRKSMDTSGNSPPAGQRSEPSAAILREKVADLVERLDEDQRRLLQLVMDFLQQVTREAAVNSMSSDSLAGVFAPVVCRPEGSAYMSVRHALDLKKISSVVRAMIDDPGVFEQEAQLSVSAIDIGASRGEGEIHRRRRRGGGGREGGGNRGGGEGRKIDAAADHSEKIMRSVRQRGGMLDINILQRLLNDSVSLLFHEGECDSSDEEEDSVVEREIAGTTGFGGRAAEVKTPEPIVAAGQARGWRAAFGGGSGWGGAAAAKVVGNEEKAQVQALDIPQRRVYGGRGAAVSPSAAAGGGGGAAATTAAAAAAAARTPSRTPPEFRRRRSALVDMVKAPPREEDEEDEPGGAAAAARVDYFVTSPMGLSFLAMEGSISDTRDRRAITQALRVLRSQIRRYEESFNSRYGHLPKGRERAPLASTYGQYKQWRKLIRHDAACRVQALYRGCVSRLAYPSVPRTARHHSSGSSSHTTGISCTSSSMGSSISSPMGTSSLSSSISSWGWNAIRYGRRRRSSDSSRRSSTSSTSSNTSNNSSSSSNSTTTDASPASLQKLRSPSLSPAGALLLSPPPSESVSRSGSGPQGFLTPVQQSRWSNINANSSPPPSSECSTAAAIGTAGKSGGKQQQAPGVIGNSISPLSPLSDGAWPSPAQTEGGGEAKEGFPVEEEKEEDSESVELDLRLGKQQGWGGRRWASVDGGNPLLRLSDEVEASAAVHEVQALEIAWKLKALQEEKCAVKENLKHFDMLFFEENGRAPSKAEKEPMREEYERYNGLKRDIRSAEVELKDLTTLLDSMKQQDEPQEEADENLSDEENRAEAGAGASSSTNSRNNTTHPLANGAKAKSQSPYPGPSVSKRRALDVDVEGLTKEKRRLHAILKAYEKQFMQTNGRQVSTESDLVGVEDEYRRYRDIKRRLALFQGGRTVSV